MDYEQKYYDLYYEVRKLKVENQVLREELELFKSNKNYMAIALTYVKKIKELTEELNKLKECENKVEKST